MPNHVHIIIVPSNEDGLRHTFADAHQSYTGPINARMKVTGPLGQGRFGSVAMDKEPLANAVRHVSFNRVRAGLVTRAQDWKWSSVAAQMRGRDDGLVTVAPIRERYDSFRKFLAQEFDEEEALSETAPVRNQRPPPLTFAPLATTNRSKSWKKQLVAS